MLSRELATLLSGRYVEFEIFPFSFTEYTGITKKEVIKQSYIDYMEDTFLIHRVERYDIRGKETISGNCKYYINDLSFKNYLYPGFGYGIGYKLENLVYLELRRAGYDIYAGTMRDKEVDFVAKKGERLIYLQST
jgi:Predicted ATPase (AAA+ superfamily)